MSKAFVRSGVGNQSPTFRRPKRGYFEPLEDRRLLSMTPSVDEFDESRTVIAGGNPGSTIASTNVAHDLKIALEGVRATGQLDSLSSSTVAASSGVAARFDDTGRVHVSVSLASWSPSVLESVKILGLQTRVELESGKIIEGWIAPGLVEKLAAIAGVERVGLPQYLVTNVGDETTEGDSPSFGHRMSVPSSTRLGSMAPGSRWA